MEKNSSKLAVKATEAAVGCAMSPIKWKVMLERKRKTPPAHAPRWSASSARRNLEVCMAD